MYKKLEAGGWWADKLIASVLHFFVQWTPLGIREFSFDDAVVLSSWVVIAKKKEEEADHNEKRQARLEARERLAKS